MEEETIEMRVLDPFEGDRKKKMTLDEVNKLIEEGYLVIDTEAHRLIVKDDIKAIKEKKKKAPKKALSTKPLKGG